MWTASQVKIIVTIAAVAEPEIAAYINSSEYDEQISSPEDAEASRCVRMALHTGGMTILRLCGATSFTEGVQTSPERDIANIKKTGLPQPREEQTITKPS
jgi:hypothetical protein